MKTTERAPFKAYLTTNQAAALLMVSAVTIRNWVRRGWLHSELTAGGHRRILRKEIERFAREKDIAIQSPDTGRRRVLVVDDDEQFANLLAACIGEIDATIDIRVAVNSFDAGTVIRDFEPQIVVLDLLMPGLSGVDICRRLKSDPLTRAIQVIGVTGLTDPANHQDFIDSGAMVCLSKPIEAEKLRTAIHQCT